MKRKWILFLLVLAAAVGSALFAWQKFRQDTTLTILTTEIQGTIYNIGELTTAEYAYQLCQEMTKDGLTIPLTNKVLTQSQIIYSYEGIIKAGIQFEDIHTEIHQEGDRQVLVITLPEVQILSNELDNDSLTIYNERLSNFHKLTFEDVNLEQKTLKQTAEASALESGLIDRAEENAQVILTSVLSGLCDPETWEIRFQ